MAEGSSPASPWLSPARWLTAAGVLAVVSLLLALLPQPPVGPDGEFRGAWFSLLPPLVAVVLSLCFRAVAVPLIVAFVIGCLLSFRDRPWLALPLGVRDFVVANLTEQFNVTIFLFLFGLVGLVQLLGRAGGLAGLVLMLSRFARGPRSAKLATALAGCVIFFDDYSSVVVTGSTMRGITDRYRVSREKLAYIADSTCAPLAGLAVLSTWIAFEVFLLGDAMAALGRPEGGYAVFLMAVPLRFYCWGTLMFVFLNAALHRDFGPMLAAERRAAAATQDAGMHAQSSAGTPEAMAPAPGVVPRASTAIVPLAIVVLGSLAGIVALGASRMAAAGAPFDLASLASWREAFGRTTDPSYGGAGAMTVLLVATLAAAGVAIATTVARRELGPRECMMGWVRAIPTLRLAIFILVMAWAMKDICTDGLAADQFLVAQLEDTLALPLLPLLTFLVASCVSFATGTSFGTMGILIPLAVPLAGTLGAGDPSNDLWIWLTAAAVLDGAIFGDHVSPISDTTVLASLSSGCGLVEHVRTQAPYALVVMAAAAALGYGAAALELPAALFWAGAPAAFVGLLLLLGKRPTPLPPR